MRHGCVPPMAMSGPIVRRAGSQLAYSWQTFWQLPATQRGPVTAVTFTDERLRDDDLVFAARTAATVPGLTHHTVPSSPGTAYYADLGDLSTSRSPTR
ncbi:hypothetical protein LUX12_16415 [Streptomyces somaliensis]|uniref:hypothetical protein n=1 Tax=Streptomyces somaliensis TaxID=78355 RepID=UPI0020CFC67D|nr:hypothetical protein [Streptomyces somaliensis]MCP9946023.1 hypothetical protein [Streptomyces somaliensis]MCP9960809.1 hypothetical protein [Streptomyces somaliensis]MCP9973595.1 hypothetical protein [Streptomyces somaliensis]